jgi:hypothetical protein
MTAQFLLDRRTGQASKAASPGGPPVPADLAAERAALRTVSNASN